MIDKNKLGTGFVQYSAVIETGDRAVLGMTRALDGEFLLGLFNFSDEPKTADAITSEGSRAYCGTVKAEVPALTFVKTIETTGAGVTFFGGVLHHVLNWGLRPYSQEELTQMLSFANAAAAIITKKKGALRVMPGEQEILGPMEQSRHYM